MGKPLIRIPTDARKDIVAGVKAAFDERPETIQSRVLAFETDGKTDFMAFVEARAPFAAPIDLGPFGRHADALDLLNVYAPY